MPSSLCVYEFVKVTRQKRKKFSVSRKKRNEDWREKKAEHFSRAQISQWREKIIMTKQIAPQDGAAHIQTLFKSLYIYIHWSVVMKRKYRCIQVFQRTTITEKRLYCRPKQDSFILTWSWPKKLVTTNYNKMYCFPAVHTHTPSSVMVIQRALTGTYRYHILLDTFFLCLFHICVLLSSRVQNVTGQFCGHFGGLFWLKFSLHCIFMQLTNIEMVLIKLKFTIILIGKYFF